MLTKIEGLSYQEIGEKLGKSADAVGMLLSRAMVALTMAYSGLTRSGNPWARTSVFKRSYEHQTNHEACA